MNKKDLPKTQMKNFSGLILSCFFLSGLSGLIYEIIWMRLISRVIGGAPFAVCIILIIFMGGMGLGSYIASRKIDRLNEASLIKTYGILELVIGLYGLLVPLLLMVFKYFYALLYNTLFEYTIFYNLLIFAGSLMLLLLPVICMGATLPILCKFYVSKLSHLGTKTGRLYGLNTLGAATGALLCGFWLIQYLGVWGTMFFAIAINCVIGLICLRISKKYISNTKQSVKTQNLQKTSDPKETSKKINISKDQFETNGALVIFLVSGFCAMAYEVFWTKLLGLIVGPTTYSFTIVLVTFIVGLALGNIFFGWLADKTKNPLRLLIFTQIIAGFLALGISQVMGNSQLFFAKLIYSYSDHFALQNVFKAIALFVFMIFPTFCLGAAFPLVGKIYTKSISRVGKSIGFAYAVNTIGAVLGSFCAGFILVPLIGKENGLRLVTAIQILTPITIFIIILSQKKQPLYKWVLSATALTTGIFLCFHFPSWNRHLLSVGKYHRFEEIQIKEAIENTGWLDSIIKGAEILTRSERGTLEYYGDGIGGFTTVLKYPDPFGNLEYSMANSGKMDASSRGDMKTQTLLAHFPMIFSRDPKNVMVLGLASGITAGEVLHYPVKELDVIDINDRVVEASRFFKPWNNNVTQSPRTNIILQDGLAHLTLTKKKYDVIISEPSNPWMAGMASLFTKNFFSLAKSKLNDDGIYVQWIHCYQMDWPTFALVGRTFAQVFPNSALVSAEPSGLGKDYLLIGLKNKSRLNLEQARKNIQYTQKSNNIRLDYPELFFKLIVSEDLTGLFGKGPVNTDNRPVLEYAAPRLMYQNNETQKSILQNIYTKMWLSPDTKTVHNRMKKNVDAQIDFATYALSVYAPFKNMVDLTRADQFQKQKFYEQIESYCENNVLDDQLFKDQELLSRCRKTQIKVITEKIKTVPDKALSFFYLAGLYLQEGRVEDAIACYSVSVGINPDNAQCQNNLGFLLSQKGKTEKAIKHFQEALRNRPDFLLAHGNLAHAYLKQNWRDEALAHFKETLRIQPDLAESHFNVGNLLFQKQAYSQAIVHLKEAVRLQPKSAGPLNTLAWLFITSTDKNIKNSKSAIQYARKACEITEYKDPLLLYTLAVSYGSDNNITKAINTAELALEICKKNDQEEIAERIQDYLFTLRSNRPSS